MVFRDMGNVIKGVMICDVAVPFNSVVYNETTGMVDLYLMGNNKW